MTDSFSGQSQGASISADGTKIALFGGGVFLLDATTGSLTDVAFGFDPAISGDATKIVFDSGQEIRLVDMATGNSIVLAEDFDLTFNRNPSISGDGTRIVWESGGEIVMYETVTPSFTRATFGAHPSVDVHGTTVAFQSGGEIFMATVGGNYVDDVHVFYNNSAHDGNGPAVTEADFNAIATDKDPLHTGSARGG